MNRAFSRKKDKTWMHTPEALSKHYIPYNAKFLGSTEVEQPKGTEVVRDAVRKLKKQPSSNCIWFKDRPVILREGQAVACVWQNCRREKIPSCFENVASDGVHGVCKLNKSRSGVACTLGEDSEVDNMFTCPFYTIYMIYNAFK